MIKNRRLYNEELNRVVKQKLIPWDSLAGKSILITGASGMIGSYLVDILLALNSEYNKKTEVFALSRTKDKLEERFRNSLSDEHLHIISQDIRDVFDMNERFDYIIHAASNTHPREYAGYPVDTITTNVMGLMNVFEYARKHENCRVVVLSSVEIYGENRGDTELFDERYCGYLDCNTLRAGYPESKRLCETMAQAYKKQYGVDSVIVRLSRIYGPGVEEDDSKAMTQFINKASRHEDIVLKSKGDQLYSYTYVADAVSAIFKVMIDGEEGEAYNVADPGSDCRLREIADYLAKMTGKKVIYETPDEEESRGYSTATKALLNGEKLRKLGWKAEFNIKDGLKQTLYMMGAL